VRKRATQRKGREGKQRAVDDAVGADREAKAIGCSLAASAILGRSNVIQADRDLGSGSRTKDTFLERIPIGGPAARLFKLASMRPEPNIDRLHQPHNRSFHRVLESAPEGGTVSPLCFCVRQWGGETGGWGR
jgi:hypothetical protein